MKMCIIKTPTLTHLLMYRPMIMTMMHSFKIAGGGGGWSHMASTSHQIGKCA